MTFIPVIFNFPCEYLEKVRQEPLAEVSEIFFSGPVIPNKFITYIVIIFLFMPRPSSNPSQISEEHQKKGN